MNDVRPRQFHDESNTSEELVIDPWRSWTLLNSGTSYDVEGSFEMNTSRILQKDNGSWGSGFVYVKYFEVVDRQQKTVRWRCQCFDGVRYDVELDNVTNCAFMTRRIICKRQEYLMKRQQRVSQVFFNVTR